VAHIVLLAVYLPPALQRHAWSDDLPFLASSSSELLNHALERRRPLSGIIQTIGFGLADDIAGLVVLRLVGLVGVLCLVEWLRRLLIRSGMHPVTATLVAISAGLLPSIHQMATWSTIFTSSWLHLLGGIAGDRSLRWVEKRRRQDLVAAATCMTFVLLAYPPAAMFCWVVPTVRFVLERTPPRKATRQMGGLAIVVTGAGVAGVAILRLMDLISSRGQAEQIRVLSGPGDLVDKVIWFATHPIPVAARPFDTWSPSSLNALLTAGPVLVILILGLWISGSGTALSRLTSTSLVLAC